MASEKVLKIMENIDDLKVIELAEMVKALEERYGVSAAATMAVAAPTAAVTAPVEEKTEFDVILKDVGPDKIKVIKVVREITLLGLKDAKDLVDGAPKTVKENISKDEAASIQAKFKEVGSTVEIK